MHRSLTRPSCLRLGGDTYECEVDVPDGRGAGELPAAAAQLLRGLQTQSAEFEARAAVQLAKLNELKRRRAFLLGFATSPGDFINAIIASQARDLQVMQNGAVRARDLELRTEFYRQPWVDDAVMQYLARTEQEQQAQQQAQQAKQQAQQAQQAQAMQQ